LVYPCFIDDWMDCEQADYVMKMRTGTAKCANCKKPLHGMPGLSQNEIRKLAKTERRPSRAYGGYLCSNCTKELFRERARSI
jgi:large subunit ribosomal protein L34e